jgi:hypothetical protein
MFYREADMSNETVVVFTRQGVRTILNAGGSGRWKLRPNKIRHCRYAVCTRNARHPKVEGSEDHRSAFLVAKVRDVAASSTKPGRYWIKFSEYALVSIPDVWKKTHRNPVKYTAIEELGIDLSKLEWKRMPAAKEPQESKSEGFHPAGGAVIAEAKRGLALAFGVAPESIEITIRG